MEKKNNQDEEDKIIFNIITIGDTEVGKTAIIRRYLENDFNPSSLATIGFNQSVKELTMKDNEKITLNITDTAGQEQYRSLCTQYVKNVATVLFVFDLSNKKSFNNIKQWIQFFNDNSNDVDIPKYLIGNKKDLNKEVNEDMIEVFLDDNKDFIFKETSAKESVIEINDLFQEISEKLYDKYKTDKNFKEKFKKVRLDKKENKEKSKCIQC